jgi:hypothetical protein
MIVEEKLKAGLIGKTPLKRIGLDGESVSDTAAHPTPSPPRRQPNSSG